MSLHLGPHIDLGLGDTALIVTDGVTDNVRETEIADSLRDSHLPVATAQLTDLCRDRMLRSLTTRTRSPRLGKADDLTLLAIRRTGR